MADLCISNVGLHVRLCMRSLGLYGIVLRIAKISVFIERERTVWLGVRIINSRKMTIKLVTVFLHTVDGAGCPVSFGHTCIPLCIAVSYCIYRQWIKAGGAAKRDTCYSKVC